MSKLDNVFEQLECHGIYSTQEEINCIKLILNEIDDNDNPFIRLSIKLEQYQSLKDINDNSNKILNTIDEIDILWIKTKKWMQKQIININNTFMILKAKYNICDKIQNKIIIDEETFIKEIDNYKGILTSYTIRSAKKHFKKNNNIYMDWYDIYENIKKTPINYIIDPF
jgi:hypothetical protein